MYQILHNELTTCQCNYGNQGGYWVGLSMAWLMMDCVDISTDKETFTSEQREVFYQ
jgi:hypothetical protein